MALQDLKCLWYNRGMGMTHAVCSMDLRQLTTFRFVAELEPQQGI